MQNAACEAAKRSASARTARDIRCGSRISRFVRSNSDSEPNRTPWLASLSSSRAVTQCPSRCDTAPPNSAFFSSNVSNWAGAGGGAAVGFYGGGIVTGRFPQFPPLVSEVASLQTPWLGLFGDQDASIPVDDVEQLREALRGAKVDTDIVRYADAGHGFHCDQRPDYRPEDAADAWRRALDWFASHLQ